MNMPNPVINLKEKLTKITDHWSPKIVAQLNDYHFKLVKFQGDFVWHSHPETDEAFLVIEGEMFIDFRDRVAKLGKGELLVVPKGVEHKPRAEEECHAMLLEPAGTPNTGDTGGDRTVENPEWI
jgi:mannose-6-phosphate isomerase-like protein (cupin superfamily)